MRHAQPPNTQIDFVQLTPDESAAIKKHVLGISVLVRALRIDSHHVAGFLSRLGEIKKVPRKCARIPRLPINELSILKEFIRHNFSYEITKQEAHWLLCDYIFWRETRGSRLRVS